MRALTVLFRKVFNFAYGRRKAAQPCSKMNILVTGASGFIGSFLVEKALSERADVWAGVRGASSRRYLRDGRIRFITLDLGDKEAMRRQFVEAKEHFGAWDVVIHAAGITKSRHRRDFFAVNFEGTRNLANALREAEAEPRLFVYISSLSVFGAIREQPSEPHKPFVPPGLQGGLDEVVHRPLREDDTPQPNTAYGMSKAAAESFLRSLDGFPCVIFRPTGVYGPRERDYFLMAKSIRRHADFAAGFKRQEITFVYVKDLADAVFAAIERQAAGRTYLISDGRTYSSRTFGRLLQNAMGVKHVARLTAPLWALYAVCAVSQFVSALANRVSTLNLDKYRIMKQRNWQCDISAAVKELGYRPKYSLRRGTEETVAWYKEEKWI